MRVKTNALQGEFVQNEWFKDYNLPLMRMVMQDGTSNIDLVWINGYTREKQSLSFYMIPYLSPNYNQARFYDEANRETYDNKYYLSKYNVPYGPRIARYWMVIEGGGICWNASRFGQSMNRANGIPATGAYQPGHELYIHYYQNDNGDGYWTPEYGNWGSAGSTWGGMNRYRYLLNWGGKYFADQNIGGSKGGTSTGYIYLAQENLNDYETYKKSLYYNLTANSYTDDEQKKETYLKALEVSDMNLDTYDNIITLYKKMSVRNEGGTITSQEWRDLANKIIEAYNYYPVAMFDLLKVIRPYLEGADKLDIDRLEKEALTRAVNAPAGSTNSLDGTRTHARQLLGKAQPDPITFSFNGEKAGKLVKNPSYSLAWGYSLDGGQTYTTQVMDDEIQLTEDEIESITEENDIKINFMGLNDYIFTIDITKDQLEATLFANDLENRVVGVTLDHEWRNSEDDEWTSYREASPNNKGDKTLYVRKGATGTKLASDSRMFTFTQDSDDERMKYIPVSHLSIKEVSSQATGGGQYGHAVNAIDGNYNTRWHSAWNGSDTNRYIIIRLDRPVFLSAVDFVPAGGGNGKILDGTVYGSMDGTTWTELSRRTNLSYTNQANDAEQAIANTKRFEITTRSEVSYVKIVANRASNGNWFAARAFNLYHDMTSIARPTASVGFSTTNPTTGDVVARLINPSTNITILNNGGSDTYTFTDNGTFTFKFKDTYDQEGQAIAKVDWIDRVAPTATIKYSTESPTNHSVIATLEPSEEVTVTNNSNFRVNEDGKVLDSEGNILEGFRVDENQNVIDSNGMIIGNANPFTHEFISNGEFTFEFVDRAGNTGTATAVVDWIDQEAPTATLHYDITDKTNKDVTVTIEFDEENVRILNNNGSSNYTFKEKGEFTFKFADEAGNENEVTARVDWIDKNDNITSSEYEIKDNIIRKIPMNLKASEFRKHILADREVVIKDKNGKVMEETVNVGTGMKAWVRDNSYTFVVEADVDGNGELSITDVAKVCLHYIEEETLTGVYFEAADLDNNGEITLTDLAKIQLLLIEN